MPMQFGYNKHDDFCIMQLFNLKSVILDDEGCAYVRLKDISLPEYYSDLDIILSWNISCDIDFPVEIQKMFWFYTQRILLEFGKLAEATIRVRLRVLISQINKLDLTDISTDDDHANLLRTIFGDLFLVFTNKLLYLKHLYQNDELAQKQEVTQYGFKIPLRIEPIPFPRRNDELPF